MSKPRGRPRRFDTMISVRLTATLHDALSRESLARRIDLSDLIRERLAISYLKTRQPATSAVA